MGVIDHAAFDGVGGKADGGEFLGNGLVVFVGEFLGAQQGEFSQGLFCLVLAGDELLDGSRILGDDLEGLLFGEVDSVEEGFAFLGELLEAGEGGKVEGGAGG